MVSPQALESASLDVAERRMLDRFVADLRRCLGDRLAAIWLYGSRARGEPPHEDSDVDVIVVSRGGEADAKVVDELSRDAAIAEGLSPFSFAVQTVDPQWIAGRRRIESFFIQEVDHDKIVLHGEP